MAFLMYAEAIFRLAAQKQRPLAVDHPFKVKRRPPLPLKVSQRGMPKRDGQGGVRDGQGGVARVPCLCD